MANARFDNRRLAAVAGAVTVRRYRLSRLICHESTSNSWMFFDWGRAGDLHCSVLDNRTLWLAVTSTDTDRQLQQLRIDAASVGTRQPPEWPLSSFLRLILLLLGLMASMHYALRPRLMRQSAL